MTNSCKLNESHIGHIVVCIFKAYDFLTEGKEYVITKVDTGSCYSAG